MIAQFIQYLTNIKGYSENTARGYEHDLRDIAKFLNKEHSGTRWSTMERQQLDDYMKWATRRGYAATTINRHIAAVSSFYNYLKREGYDIKNPAKYESRKKIAKTQPNVIDTKELQEAYKHAQGVVKVMLGLLATTGIRIQELLDMEYQDIEYSQARIKVRGKGGKERFVYTSKEVLETIEECKKIGYTKGRIFTMEQRQARYMIFNALHPHCHGRQLSPHAIRHTFATNLATEGVNASIIQSLLGHESIKTTQRYIEMGNVNKAAAAINHNILQA